MRDSAATHDELSRLATEARWHAVASALVLPLILAGWLVAAVLAFGMLEMGLATVQRRVLLRSLPQPVAVPVEARHLRLH